MKIAGIIRKKGNEYKDSGFADDRRKSRLVRLSYRFFQYESSIAALFETNFWVLTK